MKRSYFLTGGALGAVLLSAWLLGANPPYQEQAVRTGYSPEQALLKGIYEELQSMHQTLRASAGGQAVPIGTPESVAKARCFSCHAPAAAEEKGKGFVLFTEDGKLEQFSINDWRRINKKVEKGEMPPEGALSPGEKGVFKKIPIRGQPQPKESK